MKKLAIIILLSLAACGHASSPEGRSKIRDENIQKQIDHLRDQNNALLDSIHNMNKQLKDLKPENTFN
jgi:cell division protein FtsB